jgi:hypothetical protein
MQVLVPLSTAPREHDLTASDVQFLKNHLTVTNYEIVIDGQGIEWSKIDEVEVAKAARAGGPAGWLVKKAFYAGRDRYHVGVYSGRNELVLPNLSLEAAKYVVQTIAYYARERIRYTGPEDITVTAEV